MLRKLESLSCVDLDGWDYVPALDSYLCMSLRGLGVRTASALIKTWANAWTTSARMHESNKLPCIFGCDAEDFLTHYLCCDPLWTAVISSSFKRIELLQSSPRSKLGLDGLSMEWLQMTSVAFSCYLVIKLGHRSEIEACIESGDHCQVLERLMGYAKVYSCVIVRAS